MATSQTSQRAGWWRLLVVLVVLIAAAAGGYWWWHRSHEPDMTTVFKANAEGVGLMDQFEYKQAVIAFDKVVELAPKWIPGRINLSIALLNDYTEPANHDRCVQILRQVLKEDAKNPYAHFCLGIVLRYTKHIDLARQHFQQVTHIDPYDADAWFELGRTYDPESEEASAYTRKAFELDPYHQGALSKMERILRIKGDDREADELMKRFNGLRAAKWTRVSDDKYTLMGKYAVCIGGEAKDRSTRPFGPLPLFSSKESKIELAPGARWAKGEDFGNRTIGDLYRAIRRRFGLTMIVLDYDRDGKLDVFLTGAVVENGTVRDLLLHNEGDKFRDVTREMGLADHPASLGAYAADYDNDDYPDLLLTGVHGVGLFRNSQKDGKARTFTDMTKKAGLDSLTGVCLGAAWLDLDQDADLDLIVCEYAESPEKALAALQEKATERGPGLAVFLNVGEAVAKTTSKDGEEALGLTTVFKRLTAPETLVGARADAINLTVSDIDHDRDVDIVALADHAVPQAILNDRLLKFHREPLPDPLIPVARWNGMLTLDSRQRDMSDFFLVGAGQKPLLLLNSSLQPAEPPATRFEHGIIDGPPLIQAKAVDIDLDGHTDLVGLSEKREPVLLHNDGQRFLWARRALGVDWPVDLQAVTAADMDGDDFPDVLLWSESAGLQILRSQGNGNKALRVEIRGRRVKDKLRCNNDGIGARIRAYAGGFETGMEMGTRSAGLAQSHEPLILGLGKNALAELVRIRWPDGTWQGELSLAAGQLHKIPQTDRMGESCPLLFTWDGEKYVFICDFLGGGALGEPNPDGTYRQPRPEESVFVAGAKLKAKDGKFILKIGEPMDEATYLDRLQLVAVDHPKEITVYPEERFAGVFPSQDVHALSEKILAVKATDHRGRDVTDVIKDWDRRTVDAFAHRSWLGFAEEHWVQLDFGDRLAKIGPKDRLFLCLAGWTDYPYPEAIIAATQAGVPLIDPVLERLKDDGTWEKIVAEVGFPAGRPRMMLVDVTGKLTGPSCVVRLRTNMQVYWDQIFLAPAIETLAGIQVAETGSIQGKRIRTTTLAVQAADLRAGGMMQEYSPDGKAPTLYDFHLHQPAPVSRLKGMMTRFGDVTELLLDYDDRFVIFGAGDELTVTFDAAKLPDLPAGWTRSYILRSWGYCKSISIHNATGETIEPLPFRAMSGFPYGAEVCYPQTPAHREYLRKYQTRKVGD